MAVTPANASLAKGASQQFTATGTYDDGSDADLTASTGWTTADPGVATISSTGVATAVGEGSTTVTAASSGVSGSTTLTVGPAPTGMVTAPVSPESGGSASLNSTPTPAEPVGVVVDVPAGTAGGNVTITESQASGPSPVGYSFAGREVDIQSPPSDWRTPLRLVFILDASAIPPSQDQSTIQIFRNGSLVEECPGATTALPPSADAPDGRPCVSARETMLSGDLQFTVLTPHASKWNLAAPTDHTAPTATIASPEANRSYVLGQQVKASYSCEDPPAGSSGLASCVGTVPPGDLIDTSSVGTKVFTVEAADRAGNRTTATGAYRVVYAFIATTGPFSSSGTVNTLKAGKDVSFTFSLGGSQGLDILAPEPVLSVEVSCPAGAPRTALHENADGKVSGLRYLASTATYEYEWVTSKAWSGTCRRFSLALRDGTVHVAVFEFK